MRAVTQPSLSNTITLWAVDRYLNSGAGDTPTQSMVHTKRWKGMAAYDYFIVTPDSVPPLEVCKNDKWRMNE